MVGNSSSPSVQPCTLVQRRNRVSCRPLIARCTLLVAFLPAAFATWEDCLFSSGSGNSDIAIVVGVQCNESTIFLAMNFPDSSNNARYVWLEYECFLPNSTTVSSVIPSSYPNIPLSVKSSYNQRFERTPLPEGSVCRVRGCFRSVFGFTYYYTVPHNCTIDTDECVEGTHKCSENSNCTNTVGSYECVCHDGYQLDIDGRTCVELDTPEVPTNATQQHCNLTCKENEECQTDEMTGNYICVCRTGFSCGGGSQPTPTEHDCNTTGTVGGTGERVVAGETTDTHMVVVVGLALGLPLLALLLTVMALIIYIIWIKHRYRRDLKRVKEEYQLVPATNTFQEQYEYGNNKESKSEEKPFQPTIPSQTECTTPAKETSTPSHQLLNTRQVKSSPSLSFAEESDQSGSGARDVRPRECEESSDDGFEDMQRKKPDKGFRNFIFTMHHDL